MLHQRRRSQQSDIFSIDVRVPEKCWHSAEKIFWWPLLITSIVELLILEIFLWNWVEVDEKCEESTIPVV